MAHNCLDWSSNPPTRKIPLLVLARGNDQVYIPVPQEFKILEQVARKEFSLGDANISFSSSCVNLCNGRPARITESTWEHLSPFIGCATVEAFQPSPNDSENRPRQDVAREDQSSASEVTGKQLHSTSQGTLPSSTDGHENEPSEQALGSKADNSACDVLRDQHDVPLDHGKNQDLSTCQHEKPWEEEGSPVLPPKTRTRHRAVVSEGEDAGGSEESERARKVPAKSQVLPAASPPKPTQSNKEIKKEKDGYQLSQRDSQHESDDTLHRPNKRIKQEKDVSESENQSRPHEVAPQPPVGTQFEFTLTQTQVEPSEKLTIRVAHRPSKQDSKFTVKGTTSVTKVLAGICKSFRLNVNRTSLYLIVSTEEDGEEENLFPCDKHDSIARAGAERDVESRFLVKVAGEV